MRILVLHGPNLNLLGVREPAVYGTTTLAEIDAALHDAAAARGAELDALQSNHEGALLDALHASIGRYDGVLLNAGSLSHTSLALHDALRAAPPTVEVHVSNVFAREGLRHTTLLAGVCVGLITGFGADSYLLGLEGLLNHLSSSRP